jgi:hypothetical protein
MAITKKKFMHKTKRFLNGIKFKNSLLVIQNITNLETSKNPSPQPKMENNNTKPWTKKLA